MSSIDVKEALVQSIQKCTDTDFLNMLQEIVSNFNSEEGALLARLSPEQKMQLEEAVQVSYNRDQLIDNAEAWKQLNKWL